MELSSPAGRRNLLLIILTVIMLVRLGTLGAYPLADTTEARYAEIARKMVETDNWVLPQEDYGVPFMAKPPLSTWLTAICFVLFGVTEFTARLSSFLLVAIVSWLTYGIARSQRDPETAALGTAILASTGLTFVTAGAVMTDGAVVLSTTLCMAAFWRALHGGGRIWGYLFFAGLAAGLLSKGLVPFVLTAVPLGIWVIWKKKWAALRLLPWAGGTVLCLALALPWYLLAEHRAPGFLSYFFIGEHLGKFMKTGWSGDLYGTSHGKPRGTIWLYWLLAAFPWSLAFLGTMLRRKLRPKATDVVVTVDDWTAYLTAWAAAPMLFFTLAGNIMVTYIMPGLPAFALLMADLLRTGPAAEGAAAAAPRRSSGWVLTGLLAVPLLVLVLMLTSGPALVSERSQKEVVRLYTSLRSGPDARLVYLFTKPHSAKFYTRGKVIRADAEDAGQYLGGGAESYFVVRNGDFVWLSPAFLDRLVPVRKFKFETLLRERRDWAP
jgi:4-amino-4-deoxy-L-arabinose transferase-like glycosyltransferase